MNEELRAELIARMDADQAVRREVSRAWPGGAPIDADDPIYLRWEEVDRENTEWLQAVVDDHGWPGRTLVGEDGAHAAWLLAQHASDQEFQRRCRDLMTEAAAADEASRTDLAYLVDRVAMHEGEPQVYGTQYQWRDGELVPMDIIDPEHVDARRATVGLGPLAEHIADINAAYRPHSQETDE